VIGDARIPSGRRVMLFAFTSATLLQFAGYCAAENPESKPMWDQWRKRSVAAASLRFILLDDDSGVGAFCRHRSEWATGADEETLRYAELVVSGDNVQFKSRSWEYDDRLGGVIPFGHEIYRDQFRQQVSSKRLDLALFKGFRDRALEWRDPSDFVSVFDGERRAALWRRPTPQFSTAVIWPEPPFYRYGDLYFHACLQVVPSLDDIVYAPILMTYRPFNAWYGGIDPSRCSTVRRGASIGGHACDVVKERPRLKESDPSRSFFVCPALDFAILRYYADAGSEPHLQIDIEYKQNERWGWVPDRWTIIRFDASAGVILEAARIAVTSFEINETSVNDSIVPLVFPERTWVRDFQQEQQYLTRQGNRRILDFEFRAGATHEQVLASAPGEAGDVPMAVPLERVWWYTLCGSAMGLGAVIFALGASRFLKKRG
jgi:hypothetical protein